MMQTKSTRARALRPASLCRALVASCLLANAALAADAQWNFSTPDSFWDIGANWDTGLPPGAFDTAFFLGTNTGNVQWDSFTGDTTTLNLQVQQAAVNFRTSSGATRTHHINDDVFIAFGGELSLGLPGEPLNLTVADQLVLTAVGSLFVTSGSEATASVLFVNEDSTVTVFNTGSKLSVTGETSLGRFGNGSATLNFSNNSTDNVLGGAVRLSGNSSNSQASLNVQTGAQIRTGSIIAAPDTVAGQSGSILVDGSGSTIELLVDSGFTLGAASGSTATLTVSNNGIFSTCLLDGSCTSTTGAYIVNPTGTINLNSGGNMFVFNDLNIHGGTLNVDGGTFNLLQQKKLIATNNAAVGFTSSYSINDSTTFEINSGSDLSLTGTLGIGTSSTGTLTVDGSGSTVTLNGGSILSMGAGTGTLNVQNSGVFNTGTGTTTARANSTININGGTFNANGNVTLNGGTLNRDGAGSFNLTAGRALTAQSDGQIAFTGNYNIDEDTTFNIFDGADLSTTTWLDVGNGSNGTLVVDGFGTSVTMASEAWWGNGNATANVTVRNDATLNASSLQLGRSLNATANVNVEDGGSINATNNVSIAPNGGSATVTVTNADSSFTVGGAVAIVGGATSTAADVNVTDSGVFTASGLTTISPNGTLTVNTGGTYNANGGLANIGGVTVDGGTLATDTLGGFGLVEISDPAGDAALTVGTNNGTSIFDGLIQNASGGAGSLKKIGAGTLTLTNANAYSGGTTIDGGTLALGHSSAAGTGPITVLGSTIDYADGVDIANNINLQNDVTLSVATGAATQSGVISETGGSFGVTKTGAGGLTLDAANTYSGDTNINAGSIIVAHADALQNSTVNINVDNGLDITTNAVNANLGALAGSEDLGLGSQTLATGLNDASTAYSGVITGASDSILRHNGTGTLTLTGGTDATPSSFGALRSQSGAVVIDGARIDFSSGALRADAGDITVRNGAGVQMATGSTGVATNSTLTVTGSGTSLGGHRLDAAQPAASTGSVVVEDGASLNIATGLIIGFGGDGDLTVQTGANASANNVLLGINTGSTGDALVTNSTTQLSTNFLNLGGQSAGSLGGTGALTVEDGAVVQVANQTLFWTSASSITVDGATLETDKLNNHTGIVGTVSISDPAGGGAALTVGTNNGSSSFDGLIEDASGGAGGAGSLKKIGAGSFTLNGANTYTGPTTIDGGTLLANNSTGSATGTGGVTVNNGGTLSGTGSVAGTTTVNAGGTVAPGASAGTLGLDDLIFEAGSTLAVELAGGGGAAGTDYDQVSVTAGVSLGGALDIVLLDGFTPNYFDEFVVVSAAARSGEFDGINGALIDTDMTLAPVYDRGVIGVTLVAALPGDANLDGTVNGLDLLTWQANLFSGDEWEQGDFNLDGLVNGLDLLIWQSHLFDSVPSPGGNAPLALSSPGVPEPGVLAVLLPLSAALLRGRGR